MNGHQNEAFSCLIGALNNPRKVNGYGADYADIQKRNYNQYPKEDGGEPESNHCGVG